MVMGSMYIALETSSSTSLADQNIVQGNGDVLARRLDRIAE